MAKRLICLVLSLCLILSAAATAENAENTAYSPLRYDMVNNKEVSAMQKRLGELGYFEGSPTGGYYSATAKAVAAFQKASGLEVNGKYASSEMLERLYADDAITASGGVLVPTPTPTAAPEFVLTYGMRDSDGVRQMQKRLQELGYFFNSITGNFFDGTKNAVEAFQKAAGLPVNGKNVDEETLDALYSESAPADGAAPSATVTPLPTSTPVPEVTQAPGATPRPALSYGMTNEQVREMQDRLRALGYFSGTPTGGYWDATAKAVASFLKAANMDGNGRTASTEALALLFSADAPIKGSATSSPEIKQLYFGMSGSAAVRAMQDRLRQLGYFNDVSTGGYYRMTAQAVADFQAAIGMEVNGNVVTVEMLEQLYADDAPLYGQTKPTATPAATETPAPTQEPTVAPTATDAPTAPQYETLSYGMTDSSAVYSLQERLQALGYLRTAPTGGYWSLTVRAMRLFLADYGLSGDGKTATPEMQAKLFEGELPSTGDGEPVYTALAYGLTKNSAVKAMQTRLKALGYFDESATGNYYAITAAAVEAFQKAANLPVNPNEASAEMQKLLFSAEAPAFGTTIQPTTPPEEDTGTQQPELSTDYQPLSYGMNGSDEVRAMQEKLKERGFFSGNATGGYWSETTKAVAAFQTYAKLPVNGKEASSQMLGMLFYTGDLDALIANGGVVPPSEDDDPSGGETDSDSGFDAEKYKDARTDVLLSKGVSGQQVDLLIMRLTELGFLTGDAPTEYDSSVVEAVKWFQNTNRLDSDGVAGPLTLKLLYSDGAMSADEGMEDNVGNGGPTEVEGEEINVSIGSVLNVDWFSTEGDQYYNRRSGMFRDGSTAIITDVATGISFRVRRDGGYNHADAEPLTAFDTWQMYKIYNYEWSWSRHAIYVTLESGVTLAASMNGMPHGSGSGAENNFDGHFCIHFLNSRTHGSDKVDPDHQAAVAKAAG